MQFGSDGCMWITTGDGGGGNDVHNNAQTPERCSARSSASTRSPRAPASGVCRHGNRLAPTPTYDLTVPVVSARHRAASGSCGGVP
jgi:hypothetical protein